MTAAKYKAVQLSSGGHAFI